jgi:zinc protease
MTILIVFIFNIFVYKDSLPNGLKILIYPDTNSEIVSCQIWYKVGSYYEPENLTGISHLLEHMAFKGSKNFPKNSYSETVRALGGIDNAFTSEFFTAYWADVGKDYYEIVLKMEADRMVNLTLAEKDFESEKRVVMEERRLGENTPYSSLWEGFSLISYFLHPYRQPVIGWMPVLERIKREDLVNWYKTYYQPNNALIMLAGNIKIDEALKKIKKYFGKIKSKGKIKERFTFDFPLTGERKIVIRKEVTTPMMIIGFKTCSPKDSDYYPLEVLEWLLLRGKTAYLYQKLVNEKNLLISISGGSDIQKDTGIFYFFLTAEDSTKLFLAAEEIYKELENIGQEKLKEEDLKRIKNRVLAEYIFAKERVRNMGFALASFEILFGTYKFFEEYPQKIEAVKEEDIKGVIKRYFQKDKRITAILLPK